MPARVIRPKPHGFLGRRGGIQAVTTVGPGKDLNFTTRLRSVVVANNDDIFISSYEGGANKTRMFRTANGGALWSTYQINPQNGDYSWLLKRNGNVIEGFNATGGLVRSSDDGVSFGAAFGLGRGIAYNPTSDLGITQGSSGSNSILFGSNNNYGAPSLVTLSGGGYPPSWDVAPTLNVSDINFFASGLTSFIYGFADTSPFQIGYAQSNDGGFIWLNGGNPSLTDIPSGNGYDQAVGWAGSYVWLRSFNGGIKVWRSSNGVNFTQVPAGALNAGIFTNDFNQVYYNSTLNEYIVVAGNNNVYISSDGITWAAANLNPSINSGDTGLTNWDFVSVAYFPSISRYVLLGIGRFPDPTDEGFIWIGSLT